MCQTIIDSNASHSIECLKWIMERDILRRININYNHPVYVEIMESLAATSCFDPEDIEDKNSLENKRMTYLRNLMNRSAYDDQQILSVLRVLAKNSEETVEKRFRYLLNNRKLKATLIPIISENIYLILKTPNLLEDLLLDLEFNELTAEKIASQVFILNCEISKKKLEQEQEETKETDYNNENLLVAIAKREQILGLLVMWIKKHYSNSSDKKIDDVAFIISGIVKALDEFASPLTKKLVYEASQLMISQQNIPKY